MAAPAEPDRRACTLGVSVVTFAPIKGVLAGTLDSLARAVAGARETGAIGETRVTLIDNGPDAADRAVVHAAASSLSSTIGHARVEVLSGHGNVGYGAGHNLAIARGTWDHHLVLNPDVVIDRHALTAAATFMEAHPDAALLAPRVVDEHGNLQYLCKRYPSPWVLGLRGFAPRSLRARFEGTLARYEMRDLIGDTQVVPDVPIASGAFMYCRTRALQAVGGFDPRFFLYFEDFDLSLRLATAGRLYYVPAIRIVHYGGHTARKGAAHVRMFAASALRFFRKHGWRAPTTASLVQARL